MSGTTGSAVALHWSGLKTELWRTALVGLALAVGYLGVRAQEPGTESVVQSDLAQQNLSRVAASASQIGDDLRKQPGLMVELKLWVAKDATDHGQVVSDSDLTDQAIFDRLASDVEFRSVATRLLQRYGYLLPKPSPASEATKAATAAGGTEQSPPASRGTAASTPPLSQAANPLNSPGPAIFAAPGGGPIGGATSTNLLRVGGTSGTALASPPNDLVASEVGTEASSRAEYSAMTAQLNEQATISNDPPEPQGHQSTATAVGLPSAGGSEAASEHRGMVREASPFTDIPSLYDMYLQASPHPEKLDRFGTEVFRNGAGQTNLLPMDLPVGPDYVVGPGDGLAIDLWGGVSQRLYRIVDREGRLTLPEVGPVLVSGRTLGDVQQAVQQVLRTQFRNVSADVSLARLRTVRVYVVGDVEHPGAYDISSLSTPLNALFVAGGPTARGSLRILKHFRDKRLVQEVDVYDLLLHGVKDDLRRLEDGDTVLVPPIGPQLTVEGMVRRPAVYELRREKTLTEGLALAGGVLLTATLRHIEVQRVEAHQKRTMLSLDLPDAGDMAAIQKQFDAFVVQGGDVVNLFPIAPYNQDAVYLEGHVLRPGRYSYRPGMKLADLVSSYQDLLPEPSEKYAEIIRLNPPAYRPSVVSFNLAAALAHPAASPVLQSLDAVRIFSRYDFENPPIVSVGGDVRRPGTFVTSGQIHLRDAIQLAGGLQPDAWTKEAQVFRYLPDSRFKVTSVNLNQALAGDPLDNLLLEPRDRIVVHRNLAKVDPPSVFIRGEVARPGRYPLPVEMHVADLISLAGGLKRSADTGNADLTRYPLGKSTRQFGEQHEIHLSAALAGDQNQNLLLHDGDTLTIRQVPWWNEIGASVAVRGEVQHPGVYGIRPGERLSSILKRAGGFLPTAYPRAIVFERVEVRQLQEKSRQELILRIRQEAGSFKASLQQTPQEQATLQQTALEQRQREIEALEQAPVTGRMVVRLRNNLARLDKSPDDVELRSGDSIYIPKRPDFVLVNGQVYNSNAITFMPGRNAAWYLRQAGGPTDQANKKAIFIVRANGSIVSGKGEWWSGNVLSTQIEPGDLVVIPEKAIGGSARWKNLLSIAQLAESASIAALVVTR